MPMKDTIRQILESGEKLSDYRSATMYWVDKDGNQVLTQVGATHSEIAYDVLPWLGVDIRHMKSDIYSEMFAHGYVRVKEDENRIFADNGVGGRPNNAQRQGLLLRAFDTGKELLCGHGRDIRETAADKALRKAIKS